MKKRLTQNEEFQIMKMVLDKFLWMGFGIMAFGFYTLVTGKTEIIKSISFLFGGAVILLIFMVLILREYEIVKH
ncbi:hypothetical protein GF327_06205 [Candidatus Woesearchaeota archaeon]|nr:hypothetical protein [Candidatus Woesearchaeota archaeon]